MDISILMHDTEIVGVEMPNFVELKVTETEPGHKGDTATGGTKAAGATHQARNSRLYRCHLAGNGAVPKGV